MLGGALALAACGGGSDSSAEPGTDDAPAAEAGTADDDPVFTESPESGGDAETPAADGEPEAATDTDDGTPATGDPASDDEPPPTTLSPGGSGETATSDDDASADDDAGDAGAEPTTTPAPEPVQEPGPPPVGGRELGEDLRAESAASENPLPDLLVDDIRRGTKVNLANLIPAERPVLVWAWAPH